ALRRKILSEDEIRLISQRQVGGLRPFQQGRTFGARNRVTIGARSMRGTNVSLKSLPLTFQKG
ncbi:MAG: hypothetical protein ACE5JU_25330, partial [Candidatus Binatia bacterium]